MSSKFIIIEVTCLSNYIGGDLRSIELIGYEMYRVFTAVRPENVPEEIDDIELTKKSLNRQVKYI